MIIHQQNMRNKQEADIILVGDSLGMVVLGYDSTIPVTVEEMIHHTKAVKRGAKDTFILLISFYELSLIYSRYIMTSARIMQEAGAHAVKIEGADGVLDHIKGFNRCRYSSLCPSWLNSAIGWSIRWL